MLKSFKGNILLIILVKVELPSFSETLFNNNSGIIKNPTKFISSPLLEILSKLLSEGPNNVCKSKLISEIPTS